MLKATSPVLWPVLSVMVILAGGPEVVAQQPDVADQVKEIVAKLEKASLDDAWKVSDDLARLGDRAVPHIEERGIL